MNGIQPALPAVYLKPGEMYLSSEPSVVVTVLGSCLSVTMFCRRRGLGGICHSLLPQCTRRKNCNGGCREGFKFVDCSIKKMLGMFEQQKIGRDEIEIKCFGGADMFTTTPELRSSATIGMQNVAAADRTLARIGLRLRVVDVGGFSGRKIFFHTHTGDVLLKRLSAVKEDRWG